MVGSDVDFIACLNVTAAEGSVIQQTKQIFQQYPHLFRDFYTFPDTIEFASLQHIPTGFLVDVIFNDLDGVISTKLTKYLIHLDDRVFDLAMIVKYWAKVHDLTEKKGLSNYAMTLLVVFYLQQRGVLPSVASLQNGAEPYFLEGWNKGFDEIQYKPRIEVSFYQILGGFFEYYDAFDFGNNIISTFTGRPVERKLFEDARDVPVEYDVYKRNVERGISRELILRRTPVIIQDPFTHYDNLAEDLKLGALAKFVGCFKSAALSYRRDSKSVFLANILSDK